MRPTQRGIYERASNSVKSRMPLFTTDGIFPVMPSEIRSEYKGVLITVSENDEAGYYRFWFQIGGHTLHGKTETKLAGVAIKRAHRVIDRKLKEVEPPP
jgi:hypothetical protein